MRVNGHTQMSSQSPAFRRTVAERMEAYRQRLAERIRREQERRGQEPRDIAYAIGISERTWDRWRTGESEPQRRNLKALAEHWGMEFEDLRPDLEEEERQLRQELDQINAKLDAIVIALGLDSDEEVSQPEAVRRARQRLAQALQPDPPAHGAEQDS